MGKMRIAQPSPLLRLLPWLMAGILLEDALATGCSVWGLLACVVLTLLLGRWPMWQSVGIEVSVLLVGMVFTARNRASLTFPEEEGWHEIEAVVTSDVVEKEKTYAADVLLTSNGRRLKVYLQKDARSGALQLGHGVMMRTRIERTDSLRLGTFNYGQFLMVNGFTGRCYVKSADWQLTKVEWGRLPRLERLRIRALQCRRQLLTRYKMLSEQSDQTVYALLAAMTLGDKSALTRDLRDIYSVTGVSHVLALSGLHLGILFSLFFLLGAYGRRLLLSRVLMIVLIWAFALLTGLSVSVVRSALMLTIVTIFSVRGGRISVVNVLCCAASVILLCHPYALFDVGFQLSFLSVFSIVMVMPVLDSFWPEKYLYQHRLVRWLWGLVDVSVAAQIGTAPMVAYYFGRLPVYFIISNIVVVPCVYAVLWLCLCYLLLPFMRIGQMLFWVVGTMHSALTVIARWPCASIEGLHPTPLQVAMVYVIIVSLYLVVVKLRRIKILL